MSDTPVSFYKRKRRYSGPKSAGEKETLLQVMDRKWEEDECEYMKAPAYGKRLFKVKIFNVRGQDLSAKDLSGTSDPFLVFHWDQKPEVKTEVKEKSKLIDLFQLLMKM